MSAPLALVVDDDGMVRMDAADILSDAGFRTVEARDADAAMRTLDRRAGAFALLMTDVRMPGARDGFALAREAAARWPGLAVLVVSGEAAPGAGDMPGGALFVAKPFTAFMIRDHLDALFPDGIPGVA